MAISWGELKANFEMYKRVLPDDEKIIFPRREAKKRLYNKEKRKRISLSTDEQNYTEFWAMHEAYMQTLGENPTLVVLAIIEAMREFNVKGWHEQQEAPADSGVPRAEIPEWKPLRNPEVGAEPEWSGREEEE